MEYDAVINKVIAAFLIAICFPLAMTSLNAMNTTGFTTTQLAVGTLIGVLVAFAFVKITMKD